MRIAGWAWVLAGMAGCAIARPATRGIEEPARMVATVLERAPVGTPVDEARRFLEREGFRCSSRADAPFLDRTGLDYLHGDRSEGGIVRRRWQVAVVHRDGKVTEVLAATGLTGP